MRTRTSNWGQLVAAAARVSARVEGYPLPRMFLAFALPVGVFLVFAQPPGQGLDESLHFYRVWTLAHGALVATHSHGTYGGSVPLCVLNYFQEFATKAAQRGAFSVSQYWHTPANCGVGRFTPFPGSAVYSPVPYVPALVGVVPLVAVHAPLPVIFFAGRLLTLAAYIGVFYLAIRIAPCGRHVLFVLGLLPTSLLLASSYSADPITIAFAALSVALTLRCWRAAREDRRAVLLLVLSLLVVALGKPTYAILAFLVFLVPNVALGSWSRPLVVKAVAVGIVLACAALWYLAVRHVEGAPVPLYDLRPHAQTQFIVHHPLGYLGDLLRTFFFASGEARWLPGFFFSIGYTRPALADSIYAPPGLIVLGSLTLFSAYFLQFGRRRLVPGPRALIYLPVVLAAVGVLLVTTTLFIYGTPAGLPEVNVQGRYFYPFVPVPLVTIGALRQSRSGRRATVWIAAGSLLMLLWLVGKIFVHDYTL
ncbi:MAG TPA: DUF2142 domain-containing protein [Acidimicrobiales bacterium]|nr:DUF2142 domain-containing protein [Acidimicrobiales bacterium]